MLQTHFRWLPVLLAFVLQAGNAFSSDTAIDYGERMYREGVLPSGEPMQAIVMGDIPVDGRMFTCDDCHQRSGLGSVEGTIVTWPTNGKELYQPRRRTGAYRPGKKVENGDGHGSLPEYYQVEDVRAAYTDNSLAKALRFGVDPNGRIFDPAIPKFFLDKKDMEIMVLYLKNLSAEISPGVDDTTLHLATVIGSQVPEKEKQAMLSVLQHHIDAHNSQNRHQERRAEWGPFYRAEMNRAYRRLDLSVWQLQGPEESWRDQLEEYYQKRPVFALIGGISKGNWQPIHTFSEQRRIPCVFPVTDLPVVSDTDWYTLYFSKGYYQEGESAAKYVRSIMGVKKEMDVVQVYRKNREGAALAEGFRRTWKKMGGATPREVVLEADELEPEELFQGQDSAFSDTAVLLLWLGDEDEKLIGRIVEKVDSRTMLFSSATLLEDNYSVIPDKFRDAVHITYPYILPDGWKKRSFIVNRWLDTKKIPLTSLTTQAKMYFLGWMLPGAIKSMRSEFFREYFVESFDMMTDQDYAIAAYPRLTFGPGQRYASKGCYIVKLSKGLNPALIPLNDWVTY
jgi:hypothetical protein